MSNYIKISGEYQEIVAIYKKQNGSWSEVTGSLATILGSSIYFYGGHSANATLGIVAESQYTGKTFILTARFGAHQVYPTWSITAGNQYATINSNGKVSIVSGTQNKNITVQATYNGQTDTKTINITYDNQLSIEGSDIMTGTSGNVIARYNDAIVTPTWSITSGNTYATINNAGVITIIGTGTIVVSATYSGYTTTKTINVVYEANTQTQTEVDPDTGTTTTTTTTTTVDTTTGETTETTTQTVTNDDGTSSTTESTTVTQDDGSSTTTSTTTSSDGSSSETTSTTSAPDSETGAVTTESTTTTNNADGTSSETNQTVVENEDGSSQSSTTTVNYDENGDTTGSTANETTNNADGSSSSSTTNYNENGDPTDQQNVDTDTSGNVNTQDVEFDENGDPAVTGYTIDTTGNTSGNGEEVNGGDGINTEFVPFQYANDGFILHIRFETTAAMQPRPPITTDTEDNSNNYLYTILGAKATRKIGNKWPGFEIRWAVAKSGNGQSGTIQLNSTLAGESSTDRRTLTGSNNIYDVTITYDPNKKLPGTVYIYNSWDNIANKALKQANKKIDDNLDLDLTIGYSIDGSGNPIRHSGVIIYEFSVEKLT